MSIRQERLDAAEREAMNVLREALRSAVAVPATAVALFAAADAWRRASLRAAEERNGGNS